MSRARLIITAVTLVQCHVAKVARDDWAPKSWIYELPARSQAEGETAGQHTSILHIMKSPHFPGCFSLLRGGCR